MKGGGRGVAMGTAGRGERGTGRAAGVTAARWRRPGRGRAALPGGPGSRGSATGLRGAPVLGLTRLRG